MTVRDLALEGLERAVNAVIKLDPDAGEQLAAMHGKVVGIVLNGTPTFTITVTNIGDVPLTVVEWAAGTITASAGDAIDPAPQCMTN